MNTIDDMFDAIAKQNKRAEEETRKISPERLALLKPGCYYMTDPGYGFKIFGEILEDKELERSQPYLRAVKAYSAACEKGEYGSDYVINMRPIPKTLFNAAKAVHWDIRQLDHYTVLDCLVKAKS